MTDGHVTIEWRMKREPWDNYWTKDRSWLPHSSHSRDVAQLIVNQMNWLESKWFEYRVKEETK